MCTCMSKHVEARGKTWVSFLWNHLPNIFPFGHFSILKLWSFMGMEMDIWVDLMETGISIPKPDPSVVLSQGQSSL